MTSVADKGALTGSPGVPGNPGSPAGPCNKCQSVSNTENLVTFILHEHPDKRDKVQCGHLLARGECYNLGSQHRRLRKVQASNQIVKQNYVIELFW